MSEATREQALAMLAELAELHPSVHETFREASDGAGVDLEVYAESMRRFQHVHRFAVESLVSQRQRFRHREVKRELDKTKSVRLAAGCARSQHHAPSN